MMSQRNGGVGTAQAHLSAGTVSSRYCSIRLSLTDRRNRWYAEPEVETSLVSEPYLGPRCCKCYNIRDLALVRHHLRLRSHIMRAMATITQLSSHETHPQKNIPSPPSSTCDVRNTVDNSFVLDTNGKFYYDERPITPLRTSRHVRVRIVATGLCGSDVSRPLLLHGVVTMFTTDKRTRFTTGNMDALVDM